MAGNTHFRSNILEQGDDTLKIKFTNASFTNMTVDTMTVAATHIVTLTSNSLTATTVVVPTSLTLNASSGFTFPSVASAALTGPSTKMLRVNVGASVFYVKMFKK